MQGFAAMDEVGDTFYARFGANNDTSGGHKIPVIASGKALAVFRAAVCK